MRNRKHARTHANTHTGTRTQHTARIRTQTLARSSTCIHARNLAHARTQARTHTHARTHHAHARASMRTRECERKHAQADTFRRDSTYLYFQFQNKYPTQSDAKQNIFMMRSKSQVTPVPVRPKSFKQDVAKRTEHHDGEMRVFRSSQRSNILA